jgi:ornithine carbamoyltransferase
MARTTRPRRSAPRKPRPRPRIDLRGTDLLSIADLSPDAVRHLFTLAADVKKRPERYRRVLEGQTLALIFEKPSLRTRTTFDVGVKQLGGNSLYLSPAEINLGKRESVYDVAKNLERWVQGIMIRTFGHGICVNLADYASIPVINGLTDHEHPCQALADFFTMIEHGKSMKTSKIVYVGDGNNVAHSLMLTAGMLGATMVVATPENYRPDYTLVRSAQEIAARTGGSVRVLTDPVEAVRDADVVYTDTWASMGQESEAEERRRIFRPYQVNAALMSHARHDAIFMHCLPAHRGEEVTDEIMDGPHSVIFDEAENRLHVQKAIMIELMRK